MLLSNLAPPNSSFFPPFHLLLKLSLSPSLSSQVTDLREVLGYMESMESKIRAARSLCDQTMQVQYHMTSCDVSHDSHVTTGVKWRSLSVEGQFTGSGAMRC